MCPRSWPQPGCRLGGLFVSRLSPLSFCVIITTIITILIAIIVVIVIIIIIIIAPTLSCTIIILFLVLVEHRTQYNCEAL